MTRPSAQWSAPIALALAFSTLLSTMSGAGPADTAGNTAGNSALSHYGSIEGIRNNAYTPLTSSATPMKSLDGSTSFSGQIQCPSSKEFLTVLLTPTAGGDANVIVGEDLNLDGTVEYSYSAPVAASGVCANGLISCNPGSWNNCRGCKWVANPAAQVSLADVSISDLGGCYCINNSCGNNLLMTRTGQILGTVGGGVTGAIQGVSPMYAITQTSVSGTSISYHGQDTGGCSALAVPATLPTAYYSTSGNLSGLLLASDGEAEAQVQSANPTSYYSLISSSYSRSANPSQQVSCSIDRVGSVATTIRRFNQAPTTGQLCTDHLVFMRIHRIDDLNYQLQYLDTSPGGSQHHNCGAAFPGEAPIGADNWHVLATVSVPQLPNGNYQLSMALFNMQNIQGAGCYGGSASLNGLLSGFDTAINTGVVCPASGAQYPAFSWGYDLEWTEDTYSENVNNGCAGQEQNQSCFLQQETVDGVITYSNYMPTGITPLSSCRTFSGAISSFTECRDWWSKSRVYRCDSGQTWDFSDAGKRLDSVVSTTQDNGLTMAYQDLRKDASGSWVSEDKSVTLGNRVDYSSPILACKTRKPSRKTDAVISGNATQYLSNPDSWDFYYKRCDDSGHCPIDAASGEQIVTDCRVINEFAEAATIMNVLESAGKDMVCSNGQVDPNSGQCLGQIHIFNGRGGTCKEPGVDTNFFQCCTTDPGSFLFVEAACGSGDRQTSEAMYAKLTHYVGSYCVDEWPLVGCVQTAQTHCVFQSKLGRIIQEQGRAQLKAFQDANGNPYWGSPENPLCRGFTPEEFQSLDFSKMDLSEFFADIQTKTNAAIQQSMKNNVQNYFNNFK